jgi:hypothetical protein
MVAGVGSLHPSHRWPKRPDNGGGQPVTPAAMIPAAPKSDCVASGARHDSDEAL